MDFERRTKRILVELEIFDDGIPPEEFVDNMLKDLMKFGIWGDSSWGRKQLVSFNVLCEKKFTLYWLDGKKEIIEGTSVTDAFAKAGYGGGASRALDFWTNGDDNEYIFKDKKWLRIEDEEQ